MKNPGNPFPVRASYEFNDTESLRGTNPYVSRDLYDKLAHSSFDWHTYLEPRRIIAGTAAAALALSSLAFFGANSEPSQPTSESSPYQCKGTQPMAIEPSEDLRQVIADTQSSIQTGTGVVLPAAQVRTELNARNSQFIWVPGVEGTWHVKDGISAVSIPSSCVVIER